ncbi:MAG: hypothetical protein U9N76_02220 [Candidatus Marinimicrobia bacterium]|nr:hypothetical protein [Candidatus Neomarinimicrobiota bacterium]
MLKKIPYLEDGAFFCLIFKYQIIPIKEYVYVVFSQKVFFIIIDRNSALVSASSWNSPSTADVVVNDFFNNMLFGLDTLLCTILTF